MRPTLNIVVVAKLDFRFFLSSSSQQMGYVEQPAAPYVQDGNGGAVVNGMGGVMPVVGGMPPVAAAAAAAPVGVMTGITRVYVGNLSWETEWQDLKDHMRSAGEVCLVDIFVVFERLPVQPQLMMQVSRARVDIVSLKKYMLGKQLWILEDKTQAHFRRTADTVPAEQVSPLEGLVEVCTTPSTPGNARVGLSLKQIFSVCPLALFKHRAAR